jgi:hypothetical protein
LPNAGIETLGLGTSFDQHRSTAGMATGMPAVHSRDISVDCHPYCSRMALAGRRERHAFLQQHGRKPNPFFLT